MRYFLFVLLICTSCIQNNKQHDYHTSDDLFIDVITEFYLAEQIIRNNGFKKDSISERLKEQIFRLHEVTDTALFYREFDVLMMDTEKYKMISDSVVKRLEALEASIKKRNK